MSKVEKLNKTRKLLRGVQLTKILNRRVLPKSTK